MGIGYAQYAQKLEQRMMVEQEQEQDYLQEQAYIRGDESQSFLGELISICDIDNINEKSGKRSNRKDCSFCPAIKDIFPLKKKETTLLNRMYVHEEEDGLVGEKSIACINITGL